MSKLDEIEAAGFVMTADASRAAWKVAYLALRAYCSNNNGTNASRKRLATERLKELGLLTKTGGLRAGDR